jgi:hypothetical protein
MITAIIQVTDPATKQKTLFKKERDGLPLEGAKRPLWAYH